MTTLVGWGKIEMGTCTWSGTFRVKLGRDRNREVNSYRIAGVTVICVSPGIVFSAHISLGMRVSSHILLLLGLQVRRQMPVKT